MSFTTKREGKPPLWSQIAIASIAYPLWVLAIGGPFATLSWYNASYAGLLLMLVTVVAGLYKPDAGA